MQTAVLGDRNVCLLTKRPLRKDIDYVLHLFACDIELIDDTIVYFLTKSDDDSRLSISLLTNGCNGTFKKINLLAEGKRVVRSTDSFMEINPTVTSYLLETLESRYQKKILEEQWKLR